MLGRRKVGKVTVDSLKDTYSLFPWSKPVGYSFEEVEKAIEKYQETITNMNLLLSKKDEQLNSKDIQINDLTKQIIELRMDLESIDIPKMDPEDSIKILENFSESNESPRNQNHTREPTNKLQDIMNSKKRKESSNRKFDNKNVKMINDSNPNQLSDCSDIIQ